MTVAQKDSTATNAMPVRIASGEFENEEYANPDIVILEGGINDLMNNVKHGYIQKSYNATKYTTFCQGMEYMFSYFKELFPKARMIFMTIHHVSAYDYNKAQSWWGAASEICGKWGVEFLDLFSLVCTAKIDGLQLHPSSDVYRDYYMPYIERALTSETPLSAPITTKYYTMNPACTIYFHNGTQSFEKGATISTDDWRINMIRCDGTTYENVTSIVEYDFSDVDTTTEGTYPAHIFYSENGINISCDVDITITGDNTTKSLSSISATKTTTTYNIGSEINTDDIIVTASYTDGSSIDVTSSSVIDITNINNAATGEYNIAISYTEDEITKTTQIQITIVESDSNTITWDDSATITNAWGTTDGIFSNITFEKNYTAGTTYNVSCKLMANSDSATNGELILRLSGITENLGTINFGEVIEVNTQLTANAGWLAGSNVNVYTMSGSGFPWTVNIKDFVISEIS